MPSALLLAAIAAGSVVPATASASAKTSSSAAYKQADRAVVRAAVRLAACQGSSETIPARCIKLNVQLQSAGRKLSAAQKRLKTPARAASAASWSLKAPTLSVAGTTLSWTKVGKVTTYVLVAKRAGAADAYSVVNGTSTTPPAIAGATVAYSVRTAVTGSAWSKTATIKYPAAPTAPSTQDGTAARLAAPVIKVSGTTLSWAKVADVDAYEFVTKVPGQADRYDVVRGTSVTPPAVAGKTVRYGLRALVTGSAWAAEVSISYPAATGTTAPTTGTPATGTAPAAPAPSTGTTTTTPPTGSSTPRAGFEQGLVSGSAITWQLPFMQSLGTKHVRMEFDINTSVATMTPIVAGYAKAGIKPLLLATFNGRTPTDAEARNLASWATAFGPNGTARQADWAAGTAVTEIEYGNETSQPWQYPSINSDPNWPSSTAYAALAQAYAKTFKTAAVGVKAANSGVGLLAIADVPARWASWTDNMYKAVPDLASYVKGWTIHPYGPGWQLAIDDALAKAAQHGAANDIPVYITEFGFATDNGRCLSDNYGWDKCMSYDAAASTLKSTIGAMKARYASRLAALYLYSASDLSNSGATTDREAYFGALKLDRTTKGSYTTEVKAELAASA
jgi:hypothetical protein